MARGVMIQPKRGPYPSIAKGVCSIKIFICDLWYYIHAEEKEDKN